MDSFPTEPYLHSFGQALLLAGCSVLVTSYTNSAVDNILIKLIEEQERQRGEAEDGVGPTSSSSSGGSLHPPVDLTFLRIGNSQSVHPAVRPYLPGGER